MAPRPSQNRLPAGAGGDSTAFGRSSGRDMMAEPTMAGPGFSRAGRGAGCGREWPTTSRAVIASATIRLDIFDVPRTRSVNEIGTSSMRPPARSAR